MRFYEMGLKTLRNTSPVCQKTKRKKRKKIIFSDSKAFRDI